MDGTAVSRGKGWQWAARRLLAARCAPSARPEQLRAVAAAHVDVLRRKQIDSLYYLALDPNDPVQRVYDKSWALQRRALEAVVDRLHALDTRALVFKGADVLARHFSGR